MADVSSNNGTIDVPNYSRAGHAVIAIKATQGDRYVNPYHLDQCNVAHQFGLTVVHYCYLEALSARVQFDHFRNQYLRGWRNGDYVAFDSERGVTTPGYSTTSDCLLYSFTEAGHEPMLYTNEDRLHTELNGIVVPGGRLWIANYSKEPNIDRGKYVLWAWQYTDGEKGPEPHFYTGIGKSDGSIVSLGPARALNIRKIRTRKAK